MDTGGGGESGGGETLIKDLERKATSLSRDTRPAASALALEGGDGSKGPAKLEVKTYSSGSNAPLFSWVILKRI